eukprot:4921369-Amphidinium_carterae.1
MFGACRNGHLYRPVIGLRATSALSQLPPLHPRSLPSNCEPLAVRVFGLYASRAPTSPSCA